MQDWIDKTPSHILRVIVLLYMLFCWLCILTAIGVGVAHSQEVTVSIDIVTDVATPEACQCANGVCDC